MSPARLETIQAQLRAHAKRHVAPQLLAVSGSAYRKIRALYQLGQRHFGENYAAEMTEKMVALAEQCPEIIWHFIGKIQKRQAKLIRQAHWVHSVGSLKEAQYLVRGLEGAPLSSKVLLQVNIGREPQKGGFIPEELLQAQPETFSALGFTIHGLMCIPPAQSAGGTAINYFQEMARMRDELVIGWSMPLPELSMGMSADYEDALEAGATWVRIGTMLFGPRPSKGDRDEKI